MLSPEQITAIAYNALEDKKAKDVKILKTAEHTVLADYFVICNGSTKSSPKPASRRSAARVCVRIYGC